MTALINEYYPQKIGELPGETSQLRRSGVTPDQVHRTHDRDVFVTSVRVVGPSRFEVRAVLPARHRFYGPSGRLHDPLLLLESTREAIFVVGHGLYDIPRNTSFISRHNEFEFDPAGLTTAGEPDEMLIDIAVRDIQRRGKQMTGARFDIDCLRAGTVVGSVSHRASFASAPVYNRLRGEHREAKPALAVDTPPVAPALVGRHDELDVLLAEAPGTGGWHLRVDPTHPEIFDHVIDHVPGNALVEAGRQAAYLATGRPDATVVRGVMSYSRYVEFDQPCLVSAEPSGPRTVAVTFTQDGHTSAAGEFELVLPLATGA